MRGEDMIGLAEKGLAELEALAADFRKQIVLEPQHSRAELGDIEWEIEKRRWRKEAQPSSNTEP
jgi:hypothetical protein